MTHVGQEGALGKIGAFRHLLGNPQLAGAGADLLLKLQLVTRLLFFMGWYGRPYQCAGIQDGAGLRESGLIKVKQGLTSLDEVLSTTNA